MGAVRQCAKEFLEVVNKICTCLNFYCHVGWNLCFFFEDSPCLTMVYAYHLPCLIMVAYHLPCMTMIAYHLEGVGGKLFYNAVLITRNKGQRLNTSTTGQRAKE